MKKLELKIYKLQKNVATYRLKPWKYLGKLSKYERTLKDIVTVVVNEDTLKVYKLLTKDVRQAKK